MWFGVVLLLSYVQRLLCGIAPVLFTALAAWFCFCAMYSGCCVAFHLAVWFCFYPLYSGGCVYCPRPVYSACCVVCLHLNFCTAVAVWHSPCPVYSVCCVALLLSYVQRLLCGSAPILFTALASPLCCLQRLLYALAAILCTAVAVWHCPYLVYSACCVVLPLSCLQCKFTVLAV